MTNKNNREQVVTLKPVRAAIYRRVSTDDQIFNQSLQVQYKQAQAMAIVKEWEIVDDYEDAGLSGTKGPEKRPELARLLSDIKQGKIDAVIVASLDRVGRNARLILDLVEKITRAGVAFISCRETLDTSTPTGQFVLTLFAAMAQLDRDTIVRRTTDGRNERARKDGEKGGNLPLGYLRNQKRIVVDPAAAAVVRRIYTLKFAGHTLAAIATVLNTEGVPPGKGGKAWYVSSVREVLSHEKMYRGGRRGASSFSWPIIISADVERFRNGGYEDN